MNKQMPAEDKMLAAKFSLMRDHPFFSVLLLQLKVVEIEDERLVPTMATDGRHLYWCRKFIDTLTKDELLFVFAHEVMHNALEHHIRRQERRHKLFNVACDYAINGELVECKVGTMPKCGLLDARFTGLGAEEIYRILLDESPNGADGGGGGDDDGAADPGGCGGVIDGCAQHDEAAKAELRAEMQTQVRQAASIAKAMQAGNMPAGLKRMIEELLQPKVDWRAVLRRFIDESSHRDFSWTRPNRRLIPHGLHVPSTISIGVSHITLVVDTSGSIDGPTLNAFAAEIRGAFDEGAVDAIHVVYCDAQVNHVQSFETGDILELQAAGGGGTRFSPAFEWVAENAPETRLVVYLTDLECGDWGAEPHCPTIWAHYGTSTEFARHLPRIPFGEAVHIEP